MGERVEEALGLNTEVFRQVFENAATGIAITDWGGRFIRCNPAFCRLLEDTEEDLQRLDWGGVTHPEERESILAEIRRLHAGEVAGLQVEQRFNRRNGETVWAHACVTALRDSQSRPGQLLLLVTDITPQKRLKQELQLVKDGLEKQIQVRSAELTDIIENLRDEITEQKKAEAESLRIQQRLQLAQKAESLSRMAGAIAHNFNNMLSAVMGNIELALFDAPGGSEIRRHLIEALKASYRAAEVSRFMLTYVGQSAWKAEVIDPAKVAREAGTLMRVALAENVYFRTAIPPVGPAIQGDGVHLTQVLINLITNAVEAIGGQVGTITLAMDVVPGRQIKETRLFPVDWTPTAGNYVCLSVTDTGSGIETENLDNIFDPFFSTKFVGRGMGLPVALGLVRTYEGAMAVESEPDLGSTFKVYLPCCDQRISAAGRAGMNGPHTGVGRGLVLVVDDEPAVRRIAQQMLERRFGYEVVTAENSAEALEIFGRRKDEFSLVLLDLSMPGMNGWQTLAALRAKRRDIPVILASGYDEAEVMGDSCMERPQAFLHKPYGLKDLQAALSKAQSEEV